MRIPERKVELGLEPPLRTPKFLKGPIPWVWLLRASQLPGKSLHVAIVIQFLAGVQRTSEIRIQNSRLTELGVSRQAASRALRALEKVGLIQVTRRRGASPMVRILEIDAHDPRSAGQTRLSKKLEEKEPV